MIRIFFKFIFCLSLITSLIFGQSNSSAGFYIGATYSTFVGKDAVIQFDDLIENLKPKYLLSYAGGMYINTPGNDIANPRLEVIISQKGARYTEKKQYNSETLKINMQAKMLYLEFPLMLAVKLSPHFIIMGGPYISHFLKGETIAKISYGGEKETDKGKIKSSDTTPTDYGYALGASINVTKMFGINLRYLSGMKTVDEEEKMDVKHSSFRIMLSIGSW